MGGAEVEGKCTGAGLACGPLQGPGCGPQIVLLKKERLGLHHQLPPPGCLPAS